MLEVDGKAGEEINKAWFNANSKLTAKCNMRASFEQTIVGDQEICGGDKKSPLLFK